MLERFLCVALQTHEVKNQRSIYWDVSSVYDGGNSPEIHLASLGSKRRQLLSTVLFFSLGREALSPHRKNDLPWVV